VTELASSSATTKGASLADVAAANVDVPLADAYALRVVLSRRLYDRGIAMQGSPALHELVATTSVALNHFDLDRLGVTSGELVKVNGPKGTFELAVELNDGVARGTVDVAFATRSDAGEYVIDKLADAASPITQIRLETR
jgi:anaerobic selenocysteine-containing dehydrogenase